MLKHINVLWNKVDIVARPIDGWYLQISENRSTAIQIEHVLFVHKVK